MAPGTGTAIPARAAMSRACNIPIRSRKSLQQQWDWSERYAPQPEILKYANHVADRFNLRSDIVFNAKVEQAAFDEATNLWSVTTTSNGETKTVTAAYVVLATGCLSNARMPDIKGLKGFKGEVYHTGHWPHRQVDFTGKRVAVIGTGSSGDPVGAADRGASEPPHGVSAHREFLDSRAQCAADAGRSRGVSARTIRKSAVAPARTCAMASIRELPDRGALDDGDNERRARYETRWARGGLTFTATYNNIALDQAANDTAADFVRDKIAETVNDPHTAKLLQPDNHPIGSKRICVDTDYYATFNRLNVTLVDIKASGIDEILPNAVRAGGKDHEVDALVLATGFDAMTGSVAKIDIRGRGGQTLNQKWAEGPRTYLGLMSEGFPNLFIITGPGQALRSCPI